MRHGDASSHHRPNAHATVSGNSSRQNAPPCDPARSFITTSAAASCSTFAHLPAFSMKDDSSVPAKRYVRGSEPSITLAACNHRRASRRRPHRHVDVDAQVRGQVPHPPILRRGRSAITLSRGSVALRPSWTHPRIHPKLRRLTRKYRCLGGIPCAVKSLKVKVRCRLTRKRSLVRVQSCLPLFPTF